MHLGRDVLKEMHLGRDVPKEMHLGRDVPKHIDLGRDVPKEMGVVYCSRLPCLSVEKACLSHCHNNDCT